ncbi:unnamed protein product [Caenorhabditis brenneri]
MDHHHVRSMFPNIDPATLDQLLNIGPVLPPNAVPPLPGMQPPHNAIPVPPGVPPPPPNAIVPPPPGVQPPPNVVPPPGIHRPIPFRPRQPAPPAESRQDPPPAVLGRPSPQVLLRPNEFFHHQLHLPLPSPSLSSQHPHTLYPMLSPYRGTPQLMHPGSFVRLPPPTPTLQPMVQRNQDSLVGNVMGAFPTCSTPTTPFAGMQYAPRRLDPNIPFEMQVNLNNPAGFLTPELIRQAQESMDTQKTVGEALAEFIGGVMVKEKPKQPKKAYDGPPRKRGRPPKQQQPKVDQQRPLIYGAHLVAPVDELAHVAAQPSTSDGRMHPTNNTSTPASSLIGTPRVLSAELERNLGDAGMNAVHSSTASLASSPGENTVVQPTSMAKEATDNPRGDEGRPEFGEGAMEFGEAAPVDSGDDGVAAAAADHMERLEEDQMEMVQDPPTSSGVPSTGAEELEEGDGGDEVMLHDARYVCAMPSRWCIGDRLDPYADVHWVSCDICHRWFHCVCIWGTNEKYEDGRSFHCCGNRQVAAAKKAFVGAVFEEFNMEEELKKYGVELNGGVPAAKETTPKKPKKTPSKKSKKGRK